MIDHADNAALVTTEWVADNLDSGIKVIEVDEDTDAYTWGHIPGAIALNWRTELQDQVRRDLVDRLGFAQLLGNNGITEGDTIVLYGGNNNWFAAYAYWLARLYGHADVRLMDGGRKKWELEDRILVEELRPTTTASYQAKSPDNRIRALRDEVISAIGILPMVDVRSNDEFIGRLAAPPHLPNEQAQKKGHIPGAKSIPWSKAANEDGSFKGVEELKELYLADAGLTPDTETITYCRIGERSSHTWFVLHELLGFEHVKNYDGSWTEYGSLVNVPIERSYWEEDD